MDQITIATLNIAAASEERALRLLDEWITPTSFDVYVLTETSDGAGTQLITSEFKAAGWAVFQRPTSPKERGVTIASRVAASEYTLYPPNDPVPGRTSIVDLNTTPGIQLVGMYVPNRGNDPTKMSRKKTYLDCWLRHLLNAPSPKRERVLLGDLNVVPTSQRPIFLPQEPFEYRWYEGLDRDAGFYDAAVMHNASRHESTWVAHTGEGYTYDHVMPSRTLLKRVVKFAYDHSTRSRQAVSDHSAIILSLELDWVNYLHRNALKRRMQMGLF